AGLFAMAFAASLVHCLLALLFASSVFRREDVLVSDSGDIAQLFHPVLPGRTSPSARASVYIFGFVFMLIYYLGSFFQNNSRWSLVTGLALIQVFIILSPPLLYLLFYRYRLVATLDLQWQKIRLANLVMLPVLTLCVLVFVLKYSLVQNMLFPMPVEMDKLFLGFFDVAPVWWVFVVLSLFAGFCEEILFRGVIQNGLRTRLGPWGALIITALMFGFFHLTPYKMVTTALLGLWLGTIYQITGSLWMSMYTHAFVNALAGVVLYTGYKAGGEEVARVAAQPDIPLSIVFGAMLVFAVLFAKFRKLNAEANCPAVDYTVPPLL
ncbi:MAG: CPBP family intramembrane metalloprotease, partial [Candidatus Riflebacteria bacterium]|nr:CPBP family intramembrane metalloprotease [Candidatus Riflebacteria bacterium]